MRQTSAPLSVTMKRRAACRAARAANVGGVDLGDGPGDADRDDVRMRRQPAVEVAAAVAEPIAARVKPTQGTTTTSGTTDGAVARGDAAFVDEASAPRRPSA